mgnify:CR=1 FL=1
MKKIIILILILIAVLMAFLYSFANYKIAYTEIKKENAAYEQYLNKEIYGTDVATVINKAVNNNEKNKISKNEKGLYIDDNENAIIIDIYILDNETTYNMQTLYSNGIEKFVQNYNLVKFKSSKVEYNEKNGRIKYILFEQVTQ